MTKEKELLISLHSSTIAEDILTKVVRYIYLSNSERLLMAIQAMILLLDECIDEATDLTELSEACWEDAVSNITCETGNKLEIPEKISNKLSLNALFDNVFSLDEYLDDIRNCKEGLANV